MKTDLKAKEELWKLKYFTMQRKKEKKKHTHTPNLQKKISKKRNQNPSRYYYNSITNLKIQHKPKLSSSKNPHITNKKYRKVGTSKSIELAPRSLLS
jgi:hypothetical protein